MSVWRYKAVPLTTGAALNGSATAVAPGRRSVRSGEVAGASAEDVRASLRRVGLQVVELKPIRQRTRREGELSLAWLTDAFEAHLRKRRIPVKAELFDGLATLLDSGVPLLEAVATVTGSHENLRGGRGGRRSMLVQVRESLRAGSSLAAAMREHSGWFDAVEVAMVEAGQLGGTLPDVLRSLAERHERTGQLTQRLVGALAYPAIVAAVGLGVVVFLSVKVLPDLVAILDRAGVETPLLTRAVMGTGSFIAMWWFVLLGVLMLALLGCMVGGQAIARSQVQLPDRVRKLVPPVVRRLAVARLATGLAALVRTGVPLVDAIRIVAPTLPGLAAAGLRLRLAAAAEQVERGDDLADGLNDPLWFDEEMRRLIQVGQASGELPALLERIGERYERQARRSIDRLAALLEPTVILLLAALVGLVVMGAVLPLIRLQEVI